MDTKEYNHYWNEIYIQMLHAAFSTSNDWVSDGEPCTTATLKIGLALGWTDEAVKHLKPV